MNTEDSPANATITLLIDLAQRGEIDPWDVDVIKVINSFFQELNAINLNQKNLPQSGQAFLWASMLVSYKADTLEALAAQEETRQQSAQEDNLEEETTEQQQRRLPQKLEHHIRRRGSAPPTKKRRVTLSELITHLKELATEIEQDSGKARSHQRSRSPSQRETAQMISHLAHNENLTELTKELEEFLIEQAPQDWINLDHLALEWERAKAEENEEIGISSTRRTAAMSEETSHLASSRVGVFWALLLLCSQSKVELSQEAFYQDLKLRFLGPGQ